MRRDVVPEPSAREEWDEQQWERFMQRADARAAKYQELYETLAAHPDRERLIAREMGWDLDPESCAGGVRCPECERQSECEAYEMLLLNDRAPRPVEDPDGADLAACFAELRNIPAYSRTLDFAEDVHAFLRSAGVVRVDDEDVRAALRAAQMAPAQVAAGHGIGYEGDSLYGNIALCKRALRNLAACAEALGQLNLRGLADASGVACLRARADEAGRVIEQWIASLRERR